MGSGLAYGLGFGLALPLGLILLAILGRHLKYLRERRRGKEDPSPLLPTTQPPPPTTQQPPSYQQQWDSPSPEQEKGYKSELHAEPRPLPELHSQGRLPAEMYGSGHGGGVARPGVQELSA
ncbi:hypothetical protein F5B20DRAFT_528510 [Whalleya microplaca]|nr:hypothetical protein F5B20DRAFT_528510 [Whalleya microplaca]